MGDRVKQTEFVNSPNAKNEGHICLALPCWIIGTNTFKCGHFTQKSFLLASETLMPLPAIPLLIVPSALVPGIFISRWSALRKRNDFRLCRPAWILPKTKVWTNATLGSRLSTNTFLIELFITIVSLGGGGHVRQTYPTPCQLWFWLLAPVGVTIFLQLSPKQQAWAKSSEKTRPDNRSESNRGDEGTEWIIKPPFKSLILVINVGGKTYLPLHLRGILMSFRPVVIWLHL